MKNNEEYIITYSGKKIYPLDMREENICLKDIAHALSLKCRFTGQTKKFYSVAEHSVLLATYEFSPGPFSWCLLHDAAEAYLPDIASPIKHHFPILIGAEVWILSLIEKKFGLPHLTPEIKSSIKKVDKLLQRTEGHLLLPYYLKPEWRDVTPIYKELPCWSPEKAEIKFLELAWDTLGFYK